jgi:micrococcal nuclease
VLVRRVVDGATIEVAGLGRVRLLGIEVPRTVRTEPASASSGRAAMERLASILLNRWVRLEYDRGAGGRSARGPAYVLLETGDFVNATLVREGLAKARLSRPLARADELRAAEDEARRARRGIWARAPAARFP